MRCLRFKTMVPNWVPSKISVNPTPENYKTDDDSAKLKDPGGTLKQVKDVVNKGAKPAMAKEEEDLILKQLSKKKKLLLKK